jgi:putrescine aminotransferase
MTASIVEPARTLRSYRRHLSEGRARLAEMTGALTEVRSAGCRVWDTGGREFLDCAGYAVFLLGHGHPAVVAAVVDQVRRHALTTRILLEPAAARAAEALTAVAPRGLERVHFVGSGAEAVETAIKLARVHGKRRLVSTGGGYHGKTMGALSLTANELYRAPFQPLLAGVRQVPFGDAVALERVLSDGRDQCVVVEPVQGEAGVIIPPPGYLRAVERLCREYDAFFVLDEVQTGLGRLGRWWGADREGITPDVLLVGKALSGGVIPVAAAVATAAAYAPFSSDPFLHTSTFSAAPVAMAAAAAAVHAIDSEGLVDRARDIGDDLLTQLRGGLLDRYPDLVVDVRGVGLLIGVELCDEHVAGALVLELLDRGVLVNHSLNAHRVIRLTPPAVFTDADGAWLLEAFADAAEAVANRHPTNDDQGRS